MIVLLGLLVALLLMLSAFFSASETALVSLSPQKAKSLALRTPHLKEAMEGWLVRPHEILTLILIGNTLVNILFATTITVGLVHLLPLLSDTFVEILSWLIGTGLIVVIGEITPKFIARAYPEKTSIVVLPWLSRVRNLAAPVLSFVMRPLIYFVPALGEAPSTGSMMALSLEELRTVLEEDQKVTPQTDESLLMVQRVLNTHNQTAESIMTPLSKVDLVDVDPPGKSPRSTNHLIDLIVEDGHTRTPVKKGGRLIGFIHCNDLLPSLLTRRTEDLLKLVRPAVSIPRHTRVADLMAEFRQSGIHMGFVQDEKGEVLGVLTLEDALEELTGEILDEYDVQPSLESKP